uniref:Putative secreted protein n=1 Tax=Anopheles marajoara TaxID=58244 RepID=A0A2M4CD63_9DIPT
MRGLWFFVTAASLVHMNSTRDVAVLVVWKTKLHKIIKCYPSLGTNEANERAQLFCMTIPRSFFYHMDLNRVIR